MNLDEIIANIGELTWEFEREEFKKYIFEYGCACCEWIGVSSEKSSGLMNIFIKDKAEKFVVIYSENDRAAIKEDVDNLIKVLNAKEVNVGKKGHICIGDGCVELPEVLKEI